jgi:tRNA A-37 threonylcarbamoyl transferase component Bud32
MTDRDLFIAALERADPAERDAWLDQACAGDSERRRRVDVLLRAHDQASKFLAAPAAEQLQPNADDPTRTAHSADETTPAAAIDLQAILTPADKPGLLGKLDHYEIQEVVGTGGMGVVLKAFDPKLHRLVAIKLMAPHLAAHGSARKRFEREARAVAAVKNEHVVAIHQVETEGRFPYLVMEFIGGLSLQDRLERHGPFDVKEILRIGMQTARGLAAAHAQGIIHRDIKPANILLENGVERVKITDFGLARLVDDANLTRSGVITGTPNYMSPEQSAGVPVDARSDLFSLGSVLYALCTGHPPFRAETPLAVLRRVADDPPRPVREINSDVPDWLDAIVRKLLAKNPADRVETANEVADLLGQHLAHLQQPSTIALPAPVAVPGEPGREERVSRESPAAPVASADAPASRRPTGPVGFAWLVVIALVAAPALLFWTHESFWDGYFRPGYVAPVYMIVSSGLLLAVLWWCRRQSEPMWYRLVLALAMSVVVGGTLIALLASWGEGSYLDKLGGASTWHNGGIGVAAALVIVSALVRAARWLAAKRHAELGSRLMPVCPPFDGRTAFAVGFGFFVVVVGLMAAMFIGSLTEPIEDRIRALWWILGGTGSLALLSFGPGVFVARRWWRKRRPEDRRADSYAAIFAGLGIGLTIATIALIIGKTPALREYVFGPSPPQADLAITWDENNVDTVELLRGGDVIGRFKDRDGKADLWYIPAGPYTVRAILDHREVYREDLVLRPNEHRQISLLRSASESEVYFDAGLFRVECSDPTVVTTITRPSRTAVLNQPGRSSVVAHSVRPGESYQFTIARGDKVLHEETVRMKPQSRRNIFIPRVVLPDRAMELRPQAGEFPTDVTRMEIAPDRSAVAVGRPGGSIAVFDVASGRERFAVDRPKTNSTAFGFSHNGQHLAFVAAEPSGEHVLRVVSAADGGSYQRLTPKSGNLANARALAYSPDGQRLVVSSSEAFSNNRSRSRIHRWQFADGERVPRSLDPLEWQDGTIEALRFTVYGAEVLAASRNHATAFVWNWETARPGAVLEEKAPLALLAAGQRTNLVASADDHMLLWSWRRGKDQWMASSTAGSIRSASLALGPDDELVAAGTQGGGNGTWEQRTAVWLWRQSTFQAILLGHTDSVLDVSFADDGKSLVSASKDGTLRFWKLP